MKSRITTFMPVNVVLTIGEDKLGSVAQELFEEELKKSIDDKYDTTVNKLAVIFVPGISTLDVMVNGESDGDAVEKVKAIVESVGFNLAADAGEIDD